MKKTKKLLVGALLGLACTTAHAAVPQMMVGGWNLTRVNGSVLPDYVAATVTFMADGTYMLATDFPLDPYSGPGMERGTFDVNPTSMLFTSTQTVDTNGQAGFSHTQGPQTGSFIDSNTMLATGPSGDFTWTRLASATNALVGSWRLIGVPDVNVALSFMADGTYMMAEDHPTGLDSMHGQNGMERGTYSWDQLSGAFSSTTLSDTTGQWGLSHPMAPRTFSLNGDVLSVTEGANVSYLMRVAPVTPVPEPEIYAMLLAGLGLVGFTARRRKNSTV